MRTIGVSKIFTGLAILKLIESGKLQSINCKVFETGGLLEALSIPQQYQSEFSCLSVQLLLVHAAGLSTCKNEPIFFNSTATKRDVINFLLNKLNLFAHQPSKVSLYSNTGYFFLGRVIEQLSGATYEEFVRQNILNPLNLNSAFIGNADGSSNINRRETNYYPPFAPNMQLWDSFGGWVASPIDLVRLAVSMDGNSAKADILSQDNIQKITHDGINSYGLGVKLDKSSTYGQVGCANSSQSILWIYKNQITYSITINSDPLSDSCSAILKPRFEAVIDNVSSWPTYDLF